MSLIKLIFNTSLKSRFQIINVSYYSSKSSSNQILDSAEEHPLFLEETDISDKAEIRNKSRLSPEHRNILLGQKPYSQPMTWYHNTIKYKKRMLGRYGMEALEIPAGLAWPTPEEVEQQKKYEKLAYPMSIQEQLQKIKEEKKKKEEAIMARQMQIAKKMTDMKQLINEIQAKISEKQAKEMDAKMKKKLKIEKIRQELIVQGIMDKSNLTDVLTQMEQDEKKKKKEMKKQKMFARQQKIIEIAQKKFQGDNIDSEGDENIEKSEKE